MGKKLSAAQKQQISATLKRKWAEKKANAVGAANEIKFAGLRTTPSPVAKELAKLGLQVEPAKYGRAVVSPLGAAPRSSKDEAMQLAVDVIDIVTPHLKSLSTETLVTLVDRILRP